MSRFAKGLLVYIVIFLLLAAVALGLLSAYLRAYEDSRSNTCVSRYLAACAEGELTYSWGASLAGLDRRFQSEEEIRAWVCARLEKATFRELRSDDPREKLYGVFDEDGVCLEKLTLRQEGEGRWGFTGWVVTGEECGVDAYTQTLDLLVPSDYTVELGEKTLDDSFVSDSRAVYSLLEPFQGHLGKQPYLKRYQVGPYLPGAELRVRDADGHEVAEEDRNEFYYLQNCSAKETTRLHEFALEYLDVYLPYAGDLERYGIMHWDALYRMIVHGGDLENRLVQARQGFGFGNTNAIEVVSDDLRLTSKLGSGYYVVDLGYRTETVGLHGPVEEDNQVRLLIVEQDGELLVEAMYNY